MSAARRVFARFHADEGHDEEAGVPLLLQIARMEPGCLDIQVFHATRHPPLFHLHSRWGDADAVEVHVELSNIRDYQARFGVHILPSLSRTLARMRSFRMMAVSAT